MANTLAVSESTREQLERIESSASILEGTAKDVLQRGEQSPAAVEIINRRVALLIDAWREWRSSF